MTLLDAARARVPLQHTGQGEHHGPCPFCGEGHDRFFVNERGGMGDTGRFHCRRCERSGNAVDFLVALYEMSAARARVELGLDDAEDWKKRPWAFGVEVARYTYRDAEGRPLLDVVRWESPADHPHARTPAGKTFRPAMPGGGACARRPKVPRVLYRLPEVLEAVERGAWVYVVEGEKDADALSATGHTATTNEGGAGKWRPEYAEWLRGARVAVLADHDEAGWKHAEEVASALEGVAAEVVVVHLPGLTPKGDVSDYLAAGHSADDLVAEVEAARLRTPGPGCSPPPEMLSAHTGMGSGQNESSAPASVPPRGVAAVLACFRSAASLASEPPPPTEWVVGRLLPRGALVQLTGATKGGGKTTLLCHALGAVRRGAPFLGEPTRSCPVVYLTEQSRGTFEPEYLARAGLYGDDSFHVLYGYDVKGHPFETVVAAAVEKCREVGAGVLAVDTFGYWGRVDDENDAARMQQALRPLQDAAASGLCVVVVHHDRKGGGETWDAGRGSSAFAGAVDVIVNVRRPQGGHRPELREIRCEGRFGDLFDAVLIELTPEGYVVHGTTHAVAESETREALRQAAPACEAEALTFSDLLGAVRESAPAATRTTLQRVLTEAQEEGWLCRVGGGKKGDPYRFHRISVADPSGSADFPAQDSVQAEGSGLAVGDGLPSPPALAAVAVGEPPHPWVGRIARTPKGNGVVRSVHPRSVRVEIGGRVEHVDPGGVTLDADPGVSDPTP